MNKDSFAHNYHYNFAQLLQILMYQSYCCPWWPLSNLR
jgi:hypothetical protein